MISNEVRSLARKKLKIRPERGEKAGKPLVGAKENFLKRGKR
jgi:hypothetical protein